MHIITIGKNDAGQRLDRYLRKLLKAAPLSLIHKMIRKKQVKVSGKVQPRTYILHPDDIVTLFVREAELKAFMIGTAPERVVDAITFKVIYEDADILVVDKPAGLPSQPGTGYQGASLIDEVQHYLYSPPAYRTGRLTTRHSLHRPALANRLDRGTSGLVLVGKTAAALRNLNAQLAAGTIRKTYVALVEGIPKPPAGTIDIPLTSTDQPDPEQPKMQLGKGKHAVTHYRTLEKRDHAALLEIDLETGRTHQIRAHLASLGHPVMGDVRYGARSRGPLMLHSKQVVLTHPTTGQRMTFDAPLPERFMETRD